MVSLGCSNETGGQRGGEDMRSEGDEKTHHSRGRHVDAGDRPRSHVIGKMAQHHTVRQGGAQVRGQGHLETRFDILDTQTDS